MVLTGSHDQIYIIKATRYIIAVWLCNCRYIPFHWKSPGCQLSLMKLKSLNDRLSFLAKGASSSSDIAQYCRFSANAVSLLHKSLMGYSCPPTGSINLNKWMTVYIHIILCYYHVFITRACMCEGKAIGFYHSSSIIRQHKNCQILKSRHLREWSCDIQCVIQCVWGIIIHKYLQRALCYQSAATYSPIN